MKEFLDKIQEQLNRNWYVEKKDIQKMVDELRKIEENDDNT